MSDTTENTYTLKDLRGAFEDGFQWSLKRYIADGMFPLHSVLVRELDSRYPAPSAGSWGAFVDERTTAAIADLLAHPYEEDK